jgi:hypothetical protein
MARRAFLEVEKFQIIKKMQKLKAEGKTLKEIGEEVGLSASTCGNWLKENISGLGDDLELLRRENVKLRKILVDYIIEQKLKEV